MFYHLLCEPIPDRTMAPRPATEYNSSFLHPMDMSQGKLVSWYGASLHVPMDAAHRKPFQRSM